VKVTFFLRFWRGVRGKDLGSSITGKTQKKEKLGFVDAFKEM